MAPLEIDRKLRSLRSRLRRLIVLAGASRLLLAVLAVLAAALLIDWTTRLETPGRLVLLASAAGVVLLALWRWLVAPLLVPLGDEELALVVERRFPYLRDRLISTVQFAKSTGLGPVSQAMVGQLARDTVAETRQLDVHEATAARPSALLASGAGLALVAACLYTAAFPAATAVFAVRFLNPFSALEWPHRTQLSVRATDKNDRLLALKGSRIYVPRGEDLNLLVRAAGASGKLWEPPQRVVIHYRFAGGGSGRRSVAMGKHAAYRTTFPTINESFSFYATGDDAKTRAYEVIVRDRPRIEDARITVQPPVYTRLPESRVSDGRTIAGPDGSLATVEITTNKPVGETHGAALTIDEQSRIPMGFVGNDAQRLRATFRLRPGQKKYAIELVDTEGLASTPRRGTITVRPDKVPTVQLPYLARLDRYRRHWQQRRPQGRSESSPNLTVTADASLPLQLTAEDDYGVDTAAVRYRRGEKAAPVVPTGFPELARMPWWWSAALRAGAPAEMGLAEPRKQIEQPEKPFDWSLAPLALTEGETLCIAAEAADDHCLSRDGEETPDPNVGRSRLYKLTVVSRARKAAELQEQRRAIKAELEKLIRDQEKARTSVHDLAKADASRIREALAGPSAERQQQRRLNRSAAEIAANADMALADMTNNKAGTLEDEKRTQALANELRALVKPPGEMIQAANRIADAETTRDVAKQRSKLTEAATKQQEAADRLREALARFEQWQHVDELLRDASELLRKQKKLHKDTIGLFPKLAAKKRAELTPEEKGAADSLAREQGTARDAMKALEDKMSRVAAHLEASKPATAKAVDQALRQARADQIRPDMGGAANNLKQVRLVDASKAQARATQGLARLVEALSRARSPYLARDLRQLQNDMRRQIEQLEKLLQEQRRHLAETALANLKRQLDTLRTQQAATRTATQKAASTSTLKKQAPGQTKHAEKAKELGRQLERLSLPPKDQKQTADAAAKAMNEAERKMAEAAQSLKEADKPDAPKPQATKADATKAQDAALKKLDEAARQVGKLQKQLAKGKPQAARLPERAGEQKKTAAKTAKTSQQINKTAEQAKSAAPAAAKDAKDASQKTSEAAKAMQHAKDQLQKAAANPKKSAGEQSEAKKHQQKAVKDIEEAKKKLAKAHDQLDTKRREQQIFELRRALEDIERRQAGINAQTRKLDQASKGGTDLTRAQKKQLAELAADQGKLQAAATAVVQRLQRANVPVFLYVMTDAADSMKKVQDLLARYEVGWMTQEIEKEIEDSLKQMLAALKQEAQRLAKKQPPKKPGGGGKGKKPSGRPAPLVPPLAQLRQLRTLQGLIHEKTLDLETRSLKYRRPLIQRLADRLARKQADLGKLAKDFAEALEKQNTQEKMSTP